MIETLAALGFVIGVVALVGGLICLVFRKTRRTGRRASLAGVLLIIAAFVGFAKVGHDARVAETPAPPISTQVASASAPSAPAPRPAAPPSAESRAKDMMPPSQRKLIEAVEAGRSRFKDGANDMAKGAARPARAKAICSALSGSQARDWVGQIATLSSNSDGKGVLSIRLAKDLYVKTWNNAVSDAVDRTLIEPDSSVFNAAVALKPGAWVVFSARFPPSEVDCIHEASVTIAGSMSEPEFIARFTSVRPLD